MDYLKVSALRRYRLMKFLRQIGQTRHDFCQRSIEQSAFFFAFGIQLLLRVWT